MSVRIETTVSLVDDEDGATVTVEPRDNDDSRGAWKVTGKDVYASDAELVEFANAILNLIEDE